MKRLLVLFLMVIAQKFSYSQNLNINFRSQVDFANLCSSLYGYVDDAGNEYALLGTWQGVSVINVTNPDIPVTVANIPSAVPTGSIVWREIKTFNHHAYVTNEKDSGLLIINLTNLPGSNLSYHHFKNNGLKTAHTCWVDENGILYLFGCNTGGTLVYDLNSNPDSPQFLGQHNGNYIHDGFVRGDTLWASEIYAGKLSIYNVSNPANFLLMGQVTTPLAFTHNSWPTSDDHYVFTTDEKPNSSLTSYDVSNFGNITKLDEAKSNPGSSSVVHNVHLKNNDFAVTSYYHDGVVIFDVSDPSNIIQSGNYDTYPTGGQGYDGDWGVYPFLPSGNIIASDMQSGLFVLTPHYQKACRIMGTVTDSVTGTLLNGVYIQITQTTVLDSTNYLGIYKTGILNSGLYDIQFTKSGYVIKVIHGVQLDSAVTVTLNAKMVPCGACVYPTGISFSSITSTASKVSWNPQCCSTYRLQYRVNGTTVWGSKIITPPLNAKTLTSLLPGTTYDIRMSVKCLDGVSYSIWSPVQTFTTLVSCNPPTNLSVTNLSQTQATVNWNSVTGAYSYKLVRRKLGTTVWTTSTILAPTTFKILTGLSANTTYQYRIQTICSASGAPTSAWTSIYTFTTLLRLEDVTVDFTIYPNPVLQILTVTSVFSSDDFIEVKDLLGRTVLSKAVGSEFMSNKIIIDVNELPSALYFVSIRKKNGSNLVKQFIKN